jgi:hypothetical protein
MRASDSSTRRARAQARSAQLYAWRGGRTRSAAIMSSRASAHCQGSRAGSDEPTEAAADDAAADASGGSAVAAASAGAGALGGGCARASAPCAAPCVCCASASSAAA